MPMAYVSCLPEDRSHCDKILEWWRDGKLGSDWLLSAPEGNSPQRRGQLNVHLLNAHALILIVGAGTAQRDSVRDEVNHALTQRKKLILMRPPGGSGALPRQAEGRPVCEFQPARLRAALEAP